MNATAIAAPIVPGRLDQWKAFSRELQEGPRHNEYAAFMKKCGLSRIRCWLQETPQGATGIILYEGETPMEFVRQMGTSQEPFALWFREKVKEYNGFDLSGPTGPPPELVTDVRAT